MESGLYVVATPIGHFDDLSARAIAVLRSADLIAAEDTRHSGRLLQHIDAAAPTLAYHDHSDNRASQRILAALSQGQRVALISDAGTPLISDPGYRLVRQVQDAGFSVYPLPGPCAAIAALSVSGLPTDRFFFEGFLPAKEGARANRLAVLAKMPATLVFYEAPHRIEASLAAMAAVLGESREATLAREITKTFETITRDTLAGLSVRVAQDPNQRKGEIVVVVAPAVETHSELSADQADLLLRLAQELPAKKAAAVVADLIGLRKKALYEYLLAHKEKG